MIANKSYFWTSENHAAGELFVELIIEMRTTVNSDGIVGSLWLFHVYIIAWAFDSYCNFVALGGILDNVLHSLFPVTVQIT